MIERLILKDLSFWAKSKGRKPIVLRGARQVGKTCLVREFAKTHFKNFIEINLEDRKYFNIFKEPLSLDEFIRTVRVQLGHDLKQPNTLLFLDEIQQIPWLLELLRFFYEEMPDLAVIATGSLLEVRIRQKRVSIPVGRVQNLYVFPLNFFEFLSAIKEDALLEEIAEISWNRPLPSPLHRHALSLYHKYIIVGGMPEIVREYSQENDLSQVNELKENLLLTYQEDVLKYAEKNEIDYISHVIINAPKHAGTHYSYNKFAASKYGSTHMKRAFDLLEQAMILNQAEATNLSELPIIGQKKRQRKLIFLDIGLVSHSFRIHSTSPEFENLSSLYRGQIAEQAVGQQLASYTHKEKPQLYYWAKQSTQGTAEVDFILEDKGRLVALEVKSGKTGKLKSLLALANSNPKTVLCRIYSGELKKEQAPSGAVIHSIPFYLLPRIKDFF